MKDSYHHGDLRNALLEVAIELIREQGFEAFTLREVARRAKVSHTAPYRHFRDKAALAAAIAEDGFVQLDAGMKRAAGRAASASARLLAAGRAYVELALRRPEHFRIMFTAPIDAEAHPAARAAADQAFGQLVARVVECQQAGDVRGGDPLTIARICWSQVHGIAQLAIGEQFAFKRQRDVLAFTDDALGAVLAGLAGRTRSRPGPRHSAPRGSTA